MAYLLVDADRNCREALAIALRLEGHEVLTASTGSEALALLRRGGVRCCVVDWGAGEVDEVLDAAARAGSRAVLTGVHPALLASTAGRHHGALVLAKPFRADELTALAG